MKYKPTFWQQPIEPSVEYVIKSEHNIMNEFVANTAIKIVTSLEVLLKREVFKKYPEARLLSQEELQKFITEKEVQLQTYPWGTKVVFKGDKDWSTPEEIEAFIKSTEE